VIADYNIRSVLNNDLFKGVDPSCFNWHYNTKNFFIAKEGDIIYATGEESNFIYLIIQGEIKIKVSGKKKFINRYLFDFFGDYEILQSSERKSSAMALQESLIYKISSELLHKLCLSNSRLNSNLNRKHKSENTEEIKNRQENILEPVSIMEQKNAPVILLEEEIKKELVKEISEDELDLIVQDLKSKQEFKSVMKKVGKVDGDENLKKELIEDADFEEWEFASEN
jgi:CRP-like cAMP-binding protein